MKDTAYDARVDGQVINDEAETNSSIVHAILAGLEALSHGARRTEYRLESGMCVTIYRVADNIRIDIK